MTICFPYHYSWCSDAYIISSLVKAYSMGVRGAKFGFIIADNGNVAGDLDNHLSDILQFIKMDGDLILSFGGANATLIDEVISDQDNLYNIYINIIQKTGCYKLDFDIESGNENKDNVNNLRNTVLSRLQNQFPNLYISFTLAGDTNGLPQSQLQIIKNAVNAGIKISIVNMMMMDNNFGNPGQDSINGCESLFKQLQSIYPNKSSDEIYGMMSPCIMPGRDDNNTFFNISDAILLSNYCSSKNIGEISYWALQRDVIGPTDYNFASLVNTCNLQFYNIFNQLHGNSIIGTNFLGNLVQQDSRSDWLKIDNVVIGESDQYKYIKVSSDIGSILDKYSTDSKTTVVNYNWKYKQAYIKTGFNPKLKNDCINKKDFTTFIKKSKINGNPLKYTFL
jgi:hypothetical protein